MNILGIEITASGGKVNWQNLRRVLYIALLTWVIGVRFLNVDPFDDFGREGGVGLDTLLDGLVLYGIWLGLWHWIWPMRPRLG